MVVFARCSPNNRAETVYALFREALPRYGRPQRIRTDHGGENVDIWRDMISALGEEAKPVLVGKSVHNQRIERHNRALNEQVMSVFKREFYQLESEGILDVNNDTDIFVYLPLINQAVSEFVAAHNCHKVSTEGNKTPEQLFWANIYLSEIHHILCLNMLISLILVNLWKVIFRMLPFPKFQTQLVKMVWMSFNNWWAPYQVQEVWQCTDELLPSLLRTCLMNCYLCLLDVQYFQVSRKQGFILVTNDIHTFLGAMMLLIIAR